MNDKLKERRNSPAFALTFAFVPAAILLTLMTFWRNPPGRLLEDTCVISAVCCFTSSFMLFRRKTRWAIWVGILFGLLNAMITLFLGCAVLMDATAFH